MDLNLCNSLLEYDPLPWWEMHVFTKTASRQGLVEFI